MDDEKNLQNEEQKEEKLPPLSYLKELVCLVAGVMLLFSLCLRAVVVSGPSMINTLHDGDYLVMLSSFLYKEPKYGDIVVISKESFDNGKPIIKRVIATEGQQVDIDFVAGVVSVDGIALDEPYCFTPTNLYEGVNFPVTVEPGCVFVMGDNRNESKDSRSHDIGMVDLREIVGKAIFIIIPGETRGTDKRDFSRIGVLS